VKIVPKEIALLFGREASAREGIDGMKNERRIIIQMRKIELCLFER
jgi:hypothetical protein